MAFTGVPGRGTLISRKTGKSTPATLGGTFNTDEFTFAPETEGGSAPTTKQAKIFPGGFQTLPSGAEVANPTAPVTPATSTQPFRGQTPSFDPLPGSPGFNQLGGTQAFQGGQLNALSTAGVSGAPSQIAPTPGAASPTPITDPNFLQVRPGESTEAYLARINQARGFSQQQTQGLPQAPSTGGGIAPPAGQPTGQPQGQGTGQPTGTPDYITDLEAQFRALQESFTKLLTPSEKVLSIQTQLENIITSAELGIEQVREQPIATPFITGQSAAIQRQAALSARPLQTQLAQLQAQRQSSIDVATTQLGFAESALDRAENRLQQQQRTTTNRRDDIFEIASNLPPGTSQSDVNRVLNARTRAEALSIASQFTQPSEQEQRDFTLGRGQTRFDAQGNIIASGTAFPEPVKPTGPGDKPPSQSQFRSAGFAQRMEQANTILEELDLKGFTPAGPGGLLPDFLNRLKSDDRQRFEQAVTNFITAKLRKESGAAIAESEFVTARQTYIPQAGDSEAVLDEKARTRQLVIDNEIREAGTAIEGDQEVGGVDIEELRAQLLPGEILARDRNTGQIFGITLSEFDSNKYESL